MSETNQNLLTAYSFLAALTENQNDLYTSVYVPICKRALSLYSATRKTHGSIDDIQEIVLKEFGIKIPIAFIKRLVRGVSQGMTNKEKASSNFALFQDGHHFSIGRYAFIDLELKVKKGKREANEVQINFENFLNEEQIPAEETPPFSDFLQKNNSRLAAFFSGKKEIDNTGLEESYYHHVQFLQHIESSNHQLYTIVESMYLGSIVVSFLEADFDFEAKFTSGETYYLDTPFILRILNLQKEEDCKAANELKDLIKTTGGLMKALSITVDEMQGLLERAISSYNPKAPTTTINEACQRRGLNKTSLIRLAADLEKVLQEEMGFTIENVSAQQKEKYAKTNDLKLLQEKRERIGTAEHDVLAYLYVREKRNGVVQSFQKAKAWFLTTNTGLFTFNRQTMPYQGVSEIVLPDALTSLLWLRNPAQLASKVKTAGLSELMAVTISEEIASKELISEFEATISSIKGVNDADYKMLLNSVAYESAKRIEKFIDKSISDPEQAAIEAQKIIEKERRRRNSEQLRLKEATQTVKKEQDEKSEIAAKLINSESDLVEFSKANQSLRASKDENLTTIEVLKQQIEANKKFTRRWLLWLAAFIVILASLVIIWHFNLNVSEGFQWVLKSGGLWSLGSFVINLIKALKGK